MSNTLRIGVGWSTHFRAGGPLGLLPCRRLRYSYRAPSFFAEAMVAAGNSVSFLRFDEALTVPDLDGTTNAIASAVDFFYVSSHGRCSPANHYRLVLHDGEWPVSGADLGNGGPSVATFDTCDLVDPTQPGWGARWYAAGRSLRLLLGFASPATIATDYSLRGRDFAHRILQGDPIGPAWLQAVHQNSYPDTDVAIAVGFGDDLSDATWTVRQMTLADLPAVRNLATPPVIAEEVCY